MDAATAAVAGTSTATSSNSQNPACFMREIKMGGD